MYMKRNDVIVYQQNIAELIRSELPDEIADDFLQKFDDISNGMFDSSHELWEEFYWTAEDKLEAMREILSTSATEGQ